MLSRPPPPRGYSWLNNGRLEKKPKSIKTVGRRHGRGHRKKRRKGGNIAGVVPHAKKMLSLMKKLGLLK